MLGSFVQEFLPEAPRREGFHRLERVHTPKSMQDPIDILYIVPEQCEFLLDNCYCKLYVHQ